jgi:glycerol-3-phosphate acyltransferase PlsY
MNYFLIIAAYLIGSIPFGFVFGKLAGIDVRKSGSGNIGATNVSRLVGKKMGILTLVADVGKGFLPMLAAAWFLRESPTGESVVMYCGAAAFCGHLFPVYLKFKGGKGVATALGVFLYLDPVAVLIALAAFIVVVFVSGYVSVGSLTAAAVFPGVSWYLGNSGSHLALAGFVSILIWVKHHENIMRLLRHEEKSFKKKREAGE